MNRLTIFPIHSPRISQRSKAKW